MTTIILPDKGASSNYLDKIATRLGDIPNIATDVDIWFRSTCGRTEILPFDCNSTNYSKPLTLEFVDVKAKMFFVYAGFECMPDTDTRGYVKSSFDSTKDVTLIEAIEDLMVESEVKATTLDEIIAAAITPIGVIPNSDVLFFSNASEAAELIDLGVLVYKNDRLETVSGKPVIIFNSTSGIKGFSGAIYYYSDAPMSYHSYTLTKNEKFSMTEQPYIIGLSCGSSIVA